MTQPEESCKLILKGVLTDRSNAFPGTLFGCSFARDKSLLLKAITLYFMVFLLCGLILNIG